MHSDGQLALLFAIGEVTTIVVNFILVYAFLQRFATRAELRKVEEDSRLRHQETKDETQRLHRENKDRIDGVERRLVQDIHDNRAANERHFGELNAGITSLNSSVQLFTNEVNRAIGGLEGKTSLIEKLFERLHPTNAKA